MASSDRMHLHLLLHGEDLQPQWRCFLWPRSAEEHEGCPLPEGSECFPLFIHTCMKLLPPGHKLSSWLLWHPTTALSGLDVLRDCRVTQVSVVPADAQSTLGIHLLV